MTTLRVASRFNGPPQAANGGYFAGLIAATVRERVRVRLLRPAPLEQDLVLSESEPGRWIVHSGEVPVAEARCDEVSNIAPPPPVGYIEALGIARRYVGFMQHPLPDCFVCGTARRVGDGLRIFAGATPSAHVVAAPWLPDRSLDDGVGKVRPEFMWAALDCPGYFASAVPSLALLGEFAVHIDRPVHIEEPCVVMGWRIEASGRKHIAGTALFDEDGERCALGLATWIELRQPPSEGA